MKNQVYLGDMGRQVCTFVVGEYLFGVDVCHVHEVIRNQDMTVVPLAPKIVRGLINLRGQIVTAIDMRQRLSMKPFEDGFEPMNVVVRNGEGAVSLLVDEIGDVLDVDVRQREASPPGLSQVVSELLECVYKLDGRLLLVLNSSTIYQLADCA